MELIGKPTINPLLFYTGKISGYFTWIVFVLSLCNVNLFHKIDSELTSIASYCLLAIGLTIIVVSLFNLGKSTRLGLPSDSTSLKTSGLYKYSRNPMYLGFNLLVLATIIYMLNVFVLILGIYSLIAYHIIIKSEERFLQDRFGEDYANYCVRVRRYF